MNGNNINDVYVDEEQRIWLSNYPSGITIRDNRYTNYKWIKHSIGNHQSLINDQVHSIIEDHDGDLCFGTSNGISLYRSKTETWHSFISSFKEEQDDKNHIFLTLCEVSPGVPQLQLCHPPASLSYRGSAARYLPLFLADSDENWCQKTTPLPSDCFPDFL
mgnify:CR=1 FL=1